MNSDDWIEKCVQLIYNKENPVNESTYYGLIFQIILHDSFLHLDEVYRKAMFDMLCKRKNILYNDFLGALHTVCKHSRKLYTHFKTFSEKHLVEAEPFDIVDKETNPMGIRDTREIWTEYIDMYTYNIPLSCEEYGYSNEFVKDSKILDKHLVEFYHQYDVPHQKQFFFQKKTNKNKKRKLNRCEEMKNSVQSLFDEIQDLKHQKETLEVDKMEWDHIYKENEELKNELSKLNEKLTQIKNLLN
jgi:hypothetical protein